jgi:hypothetical protein
MRLTALFPQLRGLRLDQDHMAEFSRRSPPDRRPEAHDARR